LRREDQVAEQLPQHCQQLVELAAQVDSVAEVEEVEGTESEPA